MLIKNEIEQSTKRGTTVDAEVAEALIREIIVKRYKPGTPLREQEIADRYKVSRPSARNALRLMAYAGFVEVLPFKGARVIAMGFDQFLDILGLLEDIYARCAALAALRMPANAFNELDAILSALEMASQEASEKATLYKLSFGFGEIIGKYTGSPIAERLLNQVGRLALWQQRLLMPGTPESESQSLDAHRLTAAGIKGRQSEVAAGGGRSIVLITRQALLANQRSAKLDETQIV